MISFNIKTKIAFLIFVLLMIILGSILGFALPQIEDSLEKEALNNLHTQASFYVHEIEHHLTDNLVEINLLSRNPVFLEENISSDKISRQLNNAKLNFPKYEDITFVNSNGDTLVSTDYGFRGNWNTNKWFNTALNNESIISDAHVIINPWKLVLQFFSPVVNREEVIGVIVAQVNFNEIWQILDNISIGKTGYIRLINNDGKLLYHENKFNIFNDISIANKDYISSEEKIGTGTYQTDKKTMVYHYHHLADELIFNNDGQWTIIIFQNEEEVYASILNFRENMLYISILLTIIIIFIGYFFSKSITNPLNILKNGMEIISDGNLEYKIQTVSNDEIGKVAQSFNIMSQKLLTSTNQLRNLNINLEKEVEKRTKELVQSKKEIEKQNIELKKVNKLKSDFLNVTSHELRTPMTAMKGYLQMLINKKFGRVNKEQKKALEVIHRNTERLDHLVQDILDTSRLESGTMKFVPKKVKITQFINEIVETMQATGNIKKIKIKAYIEDNIPDLIIDDYRLSQVLRNLINNAIKFSPDGSKINVKVKTDKNKALFEVQDFGIGIPKEKQKQVFKVFYQVESGSDRTFGGTGLGLTISKGIVLGHGGDIWVESEENKGSSFKFTIPYKPIMDAEGIFKKLHIFDSSEQIEAINTHVDKTFDIDEKVTLLFEQKGLL